MPDTFEFTIGGYGFAWNYAHTVNVYRMDYDAWADTHGTADYRTEIDVFSLNYGRDDYTPADVMSYAYDWIGENDV